MKRYTYNMQTRAIWFLRRYDDCVDHV